MPSLQLHVGSLLLFQDESQRRLPDRRLTASHSMSSAGAGEINLMSFQSSGRSFWIFSTMTFHLRDQ